jgi:hypothetical protein
MNGRCVNLAFFALCMAIFWDPSSVDAQTEVSIGPSKDNTLYEDIQGSLSNGAGQHFFSGRTAPRHGGVIRRGLIAFDIADTIPAGAIIESATLTLNMSKTTTGSQSINLHRVLVFWGEGASNAPNNEGAGASATADDATWIHSFYDSELWSSPGGDYSATISASQSVGNTGFYTWGSTDQMVTDVQNWLDNPSENNGWILIGNEATTTTAKRFDTKEHPTVGNRPVLAVTFTPPTGVEHQRDGLPSQFHLAQNYPNPFNARTVIRYSLSQSSPVKLEIFNTLGQKIITLVDNEQPAGENSVQWDGKNGSGAQASSGIYIYWLKVGGLIRWRKMILLK